jgi:hypothetical protein
LWHEYIRSPRPRGQSTQRVPLSLQRTHNITVLNGRIISGTKKIVNYPIWEILQDKRCWQTKETMAGKPQRLSLESNDLNGLFSYISKMKQYYHWSHSSIFNFLGSDFHIKLNVFALLVYRRYSAPSEKISQLMQIHCPVLFMQDKKKDTTFL